MNLTRRTLLKAFGLFGAFVLLLKMVPTKAFDLFTGRSKIINQRATEKAMMITSRRAQTLYFPKGHHYLIEPIRITKPYTIIDGRHQTTLDGILLDDRVGILEISSSVDNCTIKNFRFLNAFGAVS